MTIHDATPQAPPNERSAARLKPESPPVDAFLKALVRGDRRASREVFDAELDRDRPIPRIYQDLLQPALYRVGELWETGQVTVATEHMATAITEELMNSVYPLVISRKRTGHKVVIATVEDEEHQVGAKMASDLFELHGWDAVFPGAGLTTDELLELIDREQPELLGLSFAIAEHATRLQDMLQRIHTRYRGLPILVGGQALRLVDTSSWCDLEDVVFLTSLDELQAYIAQREQSGAEAS